MDLLPLQRLGARETASGVLDFGVFLPWVSARDGNRLSVKIIHEEDQFLQDRRSLEIPLDHSVDPRYGDYWSARVDIHQQTPSHPRSAWGKPGRYVYRFVLRNPNVPEPIDWIIDPFAREHGVGKLSAITVGYQDHAWSAAEAGWKTPKLHDLVFYELMISEFGNDVDGAIERLDYLADLGINCLEVMPVSNVALNLDWGFLPIGYFGVDERFGKRRDFQRFVDEAHQRGIAVIVDAVYGHTGDAFPYEYLYRRLGYRENPFMGHFAEDMFGAGTDWSRSYVRDFFYTVNHYWLDRYHVDGFRYDCVPNYWDGPAGQGYAGLVFETYRTVEREMQSPGHWRRFSEEDGEMRLIQCAEHLPDPQGILWTTYSNSTWQNQTLDAARWAAQGDRRALTELGLRFGLEGYPGTVTHNGEAVPKAALQYIENHDHSRFVCNFRTIPGDNELLQQGDRSLWYRVQPYLIGLLTAKGIPMLWQGQELGENYWLPGSGTGRVMVWRPVRWDYFYDDIGRSVLGLVRKLLGLRREREQFRRGDHFFYNDWNLYQSRGVLLFSRRLGDAFSLVALNFGDEDQTVPFRFPLAGHYREELHGGDNLSGVSTDAQVPLTIPSHYGRIWTR